MTPLTLVIDRHFRGVGRIKKATGTTNAVVKRKMSRALTELHEAGRLDILRAIRDGHLTILEVYAAHQRKELGSLPTADTVRPLATAFRAWVQELRDDAEYSEHHVTTMGTTANYLEEEDAKATVADLPAILERLRKTLGRKHPRSFNLTRSHCMAYVRATLKTSHPLYAAVAAVEPRKVPKRAARPDLTPDWMRNTFPAPAVDPVDAIAWSMATTGMGQGELWGAWVVLGDRVRIHGTKREARVRDVPLVRIPVAPRLHRRTFENKLRERAPAVEAYDLRRCFSRWLESAGVPRVRRKMYMGHASGDVTELYERHEVEAYLRADAVKLREWAGLADPTVPLKLEKSE